MKKIVSFIVVVLLTACGNGNDESKENNPVQNNQQRKTSEGITSEYLLGKWCYTQYISPEGRIKKENEIKEFMEDGKLMRQTWPFQGKAKHDMDWKIVDDKLKMKPPHIKSFGSSYKTTIVSQDELIIEQYDAKEYLHRGACTEKGI